MSKRTYSDGIGSTGSKGYVGAVVALIVVVVVVVAFLMLNPFVQIDQGSVGLVTRFGALTNSVYQPGLHMRDPFTESVVVMNERFRTDEIPVNGASQDAQQLNGPVAVTYAIDPQLPAIRDLYSHVGANYDDLFAQQAVAPIKSALTQFTALEFLQKRPQVEALAQQDLNATLAPYHIHVNTVGMKDVKFSDQFNKAIEDKVTAQQHLAQVNYDSQAQVIQAQNEARANIARTQGVAQANIEAAKGEAQAITLKADAQAKANTLIRQSLSPELIQLTQAQRWDGHLPQYQFGGNGGNLLFNVPTPAATPVK